jgi:hypothetical protein
MSSERNFNNYRAGDNVHELANGLIPEIAERFSVQLSTVPTVEELGTLVGVVGKNKVLRENEETTLLSIEEAADYVDRSGVLLQFKGAVKGVGDLSNISGSLDKLVMGGGVANWQDRVATMVVEKQQRNYAVDGPGIDVHGIHLPIGNRVMQSPSELSNLNVQKYIELADTPPTEAQYASAFVIPRLQEAGLHNIDLYAYETADGDEIARRFMQDHPEVFLGITEMPLGDDEYMDVLSFVTVAATATAGIQRALQFRAAARAIDPQFDEQIMYWNNEMDQPTNRNDPNAIADCVTQLRVLTDSMPVARSRQEIASPTTHQSPFTALRQVALTAKLLQEAYGPIS